MNEFSRIFAKVWSKVAFCMTSFGKLFAIFIVRTIKQWFSTASGSRGRSMEHSRTVSTSHPVRRTTVDGSPHASSHFNMGPDFFMIFRQKNDHSSKSVNSFDMGPIFWHSLGKELSRNVFVVSVCAFEKKLCRSKDFFVTPKKSRFSWKFDFSRNSLGSFLEASRMCRVRPGVF